MARITKSSFALAALTLILCARGYAGELKIGDAAPDFQDIIGIDDQKHSLADYKDAKLVVLVFTCNHCPVAQAYEDRLVALQESTRRRAYGAWPSTSTTSRPTGSTR